MAELLPEPDRILHTADDLKACVAEYQAMEAADNPTPPPVNPVRKYTRISVRPVWLIALIDEYVATNKYPYNADIQQLAEQRLGYPVSNEKNRALGWLVYQAQCYRRSDQIRAAGFTVATDAMLQEAFDRGLKIETPGGATLTVREVKGKLYAFKPKKRKWAVAIQGCPARLATGNRVQFVTPPLFDVVVVSH